MPSFWVEEEDLGEDELVLRGDEAHHLAVRRCREGDELEVIDGRGLFFLVRLRSFDGDGAARCDILSRLPGHGESRVELHLAAALIKGQRFDFVIEKATEIGVAAIDPMTTIRGVVSVPSASRLQRWQRLARSAAKQCGRSRVPELGSPASFESVVTTYRATCDRVVMAVPGCAGGLAEALAAADGEGGRRIGLLIGTS